MKVDAIEKKCFGNTTYHHSRVTAPRMLEEPNFDYLSNYLSRYIKYQISFTHFTGQR